MDFAIDESFKEHPVEWVVAVFCVICLAMLIHRAFFWQPAYVPLRPPVACIGEPIFVAYSYTNGDLTPHACAPQCLDEKQRYIVYRDGFATQCEPVPGCYDEGEDKGVLCTHT